MTRVPVSTSSIENAAANSQYTSEQVRTAALQLHEVLQPRINHHYERSKLKTGKDTLLLQGEGSYWFAFLIEDLLDELRSADEDIEPGLVYTVADAHLEDFQHLGATVTMSRQTVQSLKRPFYYPVRIDQPEEWQEGYQHAIQQFKELVYRLEMSPAEALDYWMVEFNELSTADWAGHRHVNPEAVRKNVRQARDKADDPELGATHPVNEIRTARLEDVPSDEDPYDPEEERVYIPRIEALREQAREEREERLGAGERGED